MSNWEDFEIECTNYLNSKYGTYATFKHMGGSDSTNPDILVRTKSGSNFFIDAKFCPAQCGQFVLLPNINTSSFEYSRQNVSQINEYARLIMDFMNKAFDEFREAGTAGKDINMPDGSDIFAKWVIDAYRKKGARYFITNNFVIFPLEKLNSYFSITAKYRIKRSGSSNVGQSRIKMIANYISNQNYSITSTRVDGDKLFATSPRNLHNRRFIMDAYEYMFSLRGGEFEIRKLANTYNANVIFTITRKENLPGLSDSEFISALQR